MVKNRIRLTETQLHNVIKESINKILKEYANSLDATEDMYASAVKDSNKGDKHVRNVNYDLY